MNLLLEVQHTGTPFSKESCMPPTVSASFMATPVEVDADIDFDFDGDVDLPPTRGKLSGACAEAVQALTRLQRLITPIIGPDAAVVWM
jgi:hypothetical protein